jgi:hypothetical protein
MTVPAGFRRVNVAPALLANQIHLKNISMSHSDNQALSKSLLTDCILQKMLLTNRADPFATDTICIHISDVRSIVDESTPVVYVDNAGHVVSRVSSEQVESLIGPHVDSIRGTSSVKNEYHFLPEDWMPSQETMDKIEAMGFVSEIQKESLLAEMRLWSMVNGSKKKLDWDYALLSFASRIRFAEASHKSIALQEDLKVALLECEALRKQLAQRSDVPQAVPVTDAVDSLKSPKPRKKYARKSAKVKGE